MKFVNEREQSVLVGDFQGETFETFREKHLRLAERNKMDFDDGT
jgi:hypothetical protein